MKSKFVFSFVFFNDAEIPSLLKEKSFCQEETERVVHPAD